MRAALTPIVAGSRGMAALYEQALDALATAVVVQDTARRVVYANTAAEHLFALSRRALVGRRLADVFDACASLEAIVVRAAQTGASCGEQEIALAGAGRVLHVACTASPLDDGVHVLLELRPLDRQLHALREERLREQQQANRELMRSLAHEIKNPLGGIRGAAQLLEGELARPALAEYTQVIISEADRLRALVDRLLGPHRAPAFRRVNVHEVLVRVKGLVQAEFPRVPVVCDFDASLPELDADPEQLLQALLNIARNAAQALASSATPPPQVRLVTRVARSVTLAKRRHRLALAVGIEDNGPGVAEAIRERIFYPLVSGRDGGSGLGLTIAQTLIAGHGGAIEWTSAPGRTVFTVFLPQARGEGDPS
jgi:two-component system nitrogen regulation sensor histidine kinase GlnL